MTVVYVVCFVLLGCAAMLAVYRLERGPSMFDRIVSVDVMTAIIVGTVTLVAAVTNRTDLVPVLVVLTLVGFVGSVSIARFAAAEAADEARILTKEELAQILAEREELTADDAPPVHDVDTNVVIAVLQVPRRDRARPEAPPRGGGRMAASEPAGTPVEPDEGEDALVAGREPEPHERDDSDPSAPAGSPEIGGAR